MRFVRSTLLLTLLAVPGCYRWVPHAGGALPAGTEVRLRLNEEGAEDVRRRFGRFDGTVSGPVAAWNQQRIAVLTETTVRREGFPSTLISDTVSVPGTYVSGIDVHEIDATKSMVVVAGALVGAVGLVFATRSLGGSEEGGEGEGPPPDAFTVFSIPFGFGWGGR